MARTAQNQPKRRPREERVEEILNMAQSVFCERGYESTAMSEIASRLGIVEGTVYKYFETKRTLLNHVITRWYDRLHKDLEMNLPGIREHRERVRFVIWRHLKVFAEDPAMCRLILTEMRGDPEYMQSELHRANKLYTDILLNELIAGINGGNFRNDLPPRLLRDMVYGGIEHHAWSHLYRENSFDPDLLANQITDVLTHGILPEISDRQSLDHTEKLGALIGRLEKTLDKVE